VLADAAETGRPDWTIGLVLSALAELQALRGDPEQLRTLFAVARPTRQTDPIFDLSLVTLASPAGGSACVPVS